jgi:hypothetical protein
MIHLLTCIDVLLVDLNPSEVIRTDKGKPACAGHAHPQATSLGPLNLCRWESQVSMQTAVKIAYMINTGESSSTIVCPALLHF